MQNSQEKRIINSCHACRTPIYEGEPIYTSSRGESSGYARGVYGGRGFGDYQVGGYGGTYGGTHASESWAQCAWCYDQWQAEVAANKSFWIKWWLGGIVVIIIATLVSIMAFPGLEKGDKGQEVPWHRIKIFSLGSWQVPLITPLVLVLGFILVSLIGKIFQPNVNRYRLRRRPKKRSVTT